ncbi:IS1595 family transposase, partial [Campylobacter rectus]
MDESYFGAKRVRGKRGRGAANKTPVFLLRYARSCKQTVCQSVMVRSIPRLVKNCSANELLPILKEFSELDSSTIYSDCWKAYDGLVDYAALAHYRVKHSKNEFANGKNHINGIENFFSKRVLSVAS